ncbi:MAG TPA: ATP synthase F1 subunit epsilon [candidate division Zixibacteria bacterium]|jgi:F-type H+-transporting ATPase subunit epsilon
MTEFQLSIVTPEKTIFDQNVVSLIVPAAEGYLGVMAHHAPLITTLQPGKITITLSTRAEGHDSGVELLLAISGGFLEVADNRATILADTAEQATQIDRERALQSLERARNRVHEARTGNGDWDLDRALGALHRAENRVRVADASLAEVER